MENAWNLKRRRRWAGVLTATRRENETWQIWRSLA